MDFKGTSIRLEPNKNGRMGSSPKPYTGNYNNRKTIKNEGLYKVQSNTTKLHHY